MIEYDDEEYKKELARLKARRDFSREEAEKRERKRKEEERLRARYKWLKEHGITVPPYEKWKKRLIKL